MVSLRAFASVGHGSSASAKTFRTFTLNTASTYDWEQHKATAPVNAMVSQLVKIGTAPVQFQVGGRVYADHPDGGPDWGLRFAVTFLFPK